MATPILSRDDKVIVETSEAFHNQIGIVKEVNRREVTIDFSGRIGKYSRKQNTFRKV